MSKQKGPDVYEWHQATTSNDNCKTDIQGPVKQLNQIIIYMLNIINKNKWIFITYLFNYGFIVYCSPVHCCKEEYSIVCNKHFFAEKDLGRCFVKTLSVSSSTMVLDTTYLILRLSDMIFPGSILCAPSIAKNVEIPCDSHDYSVCTGGTARASNVV
jgi:hypothetical protein